MLQNSGAAPAPIQRDTQSEHEIARILSGDSCQPHNPASFVEMAIRHRVAPLLVHAGAAQALPAADAARLLHEARGAAVRSELRDRELRRVVRELSAGGVDAVLIKGAHLAFSHYASSDLRPCDDTDLIVGSDKVDSVTGLLERAGYRRLPDFTGDTVLGQALFGSEGAAGLFLDVHWRIAAPRVAAELLRFEELNARAVPLPRLGPFARGPCPVDALAVACIQQAAPPPGPALRRWMYDVHLIAASMTDEQIEEFIALAVDRRMVALCAYSLGRSARMFPNAAAERMLRALEKAPAQERSAALIAPRRPVTALFVDLSSIAGWRERVRLVLAHLFPPPSYMHKAFATSGSAILPWLYVYRIVRGAGRWFKVK